MKTIIAIDGPAGSGKGTIAKILANKLNLVYIDSGATYRCVALAILNNNINITDDNKIIELTKTLNIEFIDNKTFLNGIDVTNKIRTKEVSEIVSPISSIIEVRNILVKMQREMAENNNVIMEGRDITTVVLPNANYKFYLDANIDVRAKRRYEELQKKGVLISLEEVKNSIEKRDNNDMNKPVGALTKTNEQIYIDTSYLEVDEVVEKMINIIGE